MNNIRLNDDKDSIVSLNQLAVTMKSLRVDFNDKPTDPKPSIRALVLSGDWVEFVYSDQKVRDEDYDSIGFHAAAR